MEAQTVTTSSPKVVPSSIADSLLPLLSFVEPSPVNLTLFPLLLLSAYLYLHRTHLSLLATAAMLAVTAAYVVGYVSFMHNQLRSKQSQPIPSSTLTDGTSTRYSSAQHIIPLARLSNSCH